MQTLRTPDERFAELADYPFDAKYLELVADATDDDSVLRMHYLDEGPPDGDVIVLLHGEPSWSYLYRHMIPGLVDAGFRCIAPDLIGFGKSDKPVERSDYSYARHVAWVEDALFGLLDLDDVVLFCQDWGGLIGLRVVAARPDRFRAVLASNTMLPTGSQDTPDAFMGWLDMSQNADELDTGAILQFASSRELSDAEVDAYRAPFPDETFKAGARIFPALVPIVPDQAGAADNRQAWESLGRFDRPFLTVFGSDDLVTKGGEQPMQAEIPGAVGQPHRIVDGARHFIQEDAPDELVAALVELAARTEGGTS